MTLDTIDDVAVLGAGSMGHGIAEVAAIAGYDVSLRDVERELVDDGYERIEWSLEKLDEKGKLAEDPDAVLDRVDPTVDLEEAVRDADLVVEAAPEKLDLKRRIFADLDEYTDEDAILASNTSSLRITNVAEGTDHPDRVVGLHFFNPPVKMDLVEVVHGEETSEATSDRAYAFAESLGKTPIHVHRDVRGFVVNSVLVPFMEEAAWMLSADEATVRDADATMVYERGYPMGPFELNDFGGIDVAYHFFDEADEPVPPAIERKVENDELGRKTGTGFYEYEDGPGVDYEPDDADGFDALRVEARMVNEAAKLVGDGVADPESIDLGLRLGGRFPGGTCKTGDELGLDTVLGKLRDLHDETGATRYEPADHLVDLVEEGHTGKDAGRGFYDYRTDPPFHYVDYGLDDDGVLTITLDRPERMNAFAPDTFEELDRVLDAVDVDDVACVVFEGAGDEAFSAGADVTDFTTKEPADLMDVDGVFRRIYEYDRPTVAKVDGFCLGAGFELLLCCDFRVATESSTFGSPEIDLGLVPGGGGTQRLTRLVGEPRAKELVLRGERIDAERAADWGILNRAVDEEAFEETVQAYVDDLVDGPPVALKVGKHLINDGQDASIETAIRMESRSFGLLTSTDDVLEGLTAFREDREPEFEGK